MATRTRRAAVACCLIAAAAGCGEKGPELIPVVGSVTIDGKAAKEGGVVYHGEGLSRMVGGIAPDGTYKMRHNQAEGVPPGHYKVTVFVTETPMNAEGAPSGLPTTLSNTKYMNPTSTPLEIDVQAAAAPGAYDLKVTH